MDQEQGSPAPETWQAWKELADGARLSTRRPEQVVAACRRPGESPDERLRGRLLRHLCELARRFLVRKVNPNMPNRGLDAVEDVVTAMSTAILDPNAKDGAGYEAAFHAKLQQRLADRVRAWRVQMARTEPIPTDADTGETLEPPDAVSLDPEEIAIANEVVAKLPDNLRRAFLLHREGFPFSSKGESIARMLGVTPGTAEVWVKKAKVQLHRMLGE